MIVPRCMHRFHVCDGHAGHRPQDTWQASRRAGAPTEMEAQPVSGPRANVQSHVRRAAEWWKESRDPKAESPLRETGPEIRVDVRRQRGQCHRI